MDLPRLTLLRQIDLRPSQEGKDTLFLARDRANGKIFTISRLLAGRIRRVRKLTDPRSKQPEAQKTMDNAAARDLFQFLHIMESMRDRETLEKARFNPIFMSLPLFDLGRYQKHLRPLASVFVRPAFLFFMAALLCWCVVLGVRNNWSILGTFSSVFSLEAILTFGLIAPFLKVVHEMGHVLVATRLGVKVRMAGIYLISFYPLPYVDCSDADFSARRRHRVLISLAGIIVDVTIGMIAFIGWHFTRGSYFHTIFGNIFVFSTLNSILFNANPLSKLDGYFAFSDLIGHRNLYTNAAMRLSNMMHFVFSLGNEGSLPQSGREALMVLYSMATVAYRIYIISKIAFVMAPKYLGLGAFCVIWGMIVMFYSPIKAFIEKRMQKQSRSVSETATDANVNAPRKLRKGPIKFAPLLILIGLCFVPFPFSALIPVQLDTSQSYSVTVAHEGFLKNIHLAGTVKRGDALAEIDNPSVDEELWLVGHQLAEAELALRNARGMGEARAQATRKQLASLNERRDILVNSRDEQIIRASVDGYFIPTASYNVREYKIAGEILGDLLPSQGSAVFTGQFPERYVSKFQNELAGAEFRLNGQYYDVEPERFKLQAIMTYQRSAGSRSYRVRFSFDHSPSELAGQPGKVRFSFKARPLWRHFQFWYENILANYRQAQLTDREKYLAQ
nr:site-2 protease family protein [uncultured Cohaesibacter sp.]